MIEIRVSNDKLKEIEKKHWKWFKNNMLKNWIAKMDRDIDDKFLTVFFEDRASFESWYDLSGYGSIIKWFQDQDDSKFNIFKEFIIGDINTLRKIKKRLSATDSFAVWATDTKVKNYFEDQYTDFRSSQDQWGGAHLINELDIKVCPYCNRHFIDTYVLDKGGNIKSNAQLDHFYPKELYPYLALSLYNLIPCCAVCNYGKLNNNEELIYPYYEGFGESAKFETAFLKGDEEGSYDISFLLGNSDNFKIELKPVDSKSDHGKKIQSSTKTFRINDLYKLHNDYVRELIKKATIYNESRIDELYTQYPELFRDREEVLQMIVSNYIDDNDLGKRPLAKLTKDICEELGLK
ncbi:hypothetical protein FC820_07160 [Clostridium sporogenes]|uniref:hypothetical protein n=1 Tax=Clostridium sporogenes TaxID=1509 RepID=UPI0013D4FDA7|nr:hypothetical protein [Clostridium sporogenes]NFE80028.1 hypothetical protein [Clostridium sporogenes]NFG68114.1 hypothetical protein [Clostridium sporogenes]